jgi:DNA-binding winged helix-turn-helix (wHTH) protein/TolB-like protein/Tfp pilus assembly protein PilF
MQAKRSGTYEFGRFHLDAAERLLLKDGRPVALMPKAFDTLLLLVENSGRLLDKEELIRSVWPDSFVEENSLNRSIYVLRKALGESPDQIKYIETVPKCGYRFVASVIQVNGEADLILEKYTSAEIVTEEEEEITDSKNSEPDPFEREALTINARPTVKPVSTLRRHSAAISGAIAVAALASLMYFWTTGKLTRAATTPKVKSIAILPFQNLGSGADDEHLGIGVADVLITRLSNLKEINVRPTSAVLKFEGQNNDSVAVGRVLEVDAVLEGSLQQRGDRIRVTARLVRVNDQSPIWAGQFDEQAKDLLAVQDRISEQLADSLALNLSGSEKATLTKRYTESADAYQFYFRARYHWNKRSWPEMTQAEYFFRRAIEKDPNFALAYVGLADVLFTGSANSEAYAAIKKALELDNNLGEAYATSGFASMFHGWHWKEAEENFNRAIELSPGCGTAHQWYATLLAMTGRADQAKMEMRRALDIDPMSYNFLADLGQMHYFAHEYGEAEAYCRKALEVHPEFSFAHQYLFNIYMKIGRYDEAFEEFLKEYETFVADSRYSNESPGGFLSSYRETYRQAGMKGFLRLIISEELPARGGGFSYELARHYALLGEKEQALDWLEKSCESRDFLLPFVNPDPVFDDFRSEPRYQAVLHRMGLTY